MKNDNPHKSCTGGSCTATGERRAGRAASMPPLPEPLAFAANRPRDKKEGWEDHLFDSPHAGRVNRETTPLKEGCYYIRLLPHSFDPPARYHYEGTFRFQVNDGAVISSGDLYTRDFCDGPVFCPTVTGRGGRNRIPIFPRKNYAYYLRVTSIAPASEHLDKADLTFEPYHFDHTADAWEYADAPLTARLALRTGGDGVRSWCGYVETASGVVMGHMSAVWISPFLRQGEVEIDCAEGCEPPLVNSRGDDWSHVFARAGWDVFFRVGNRDVKNNGNNRWTTAELHQAMMANREKVDLDKRWRYHMLAVPQFDDYDAFGVMYDHTCRDVNAIPREGAAIAAGILFEDHEVWGKCRKARFGETGDPYFRTAVHEIGHAMMLRHPDNDHENYIMQRTVSVAINAEEPIQFPENIQWDFSPRDVHSLCHLPDIAVRPGGVSFGSPIQRMPINARYEIMRLEGLELTVKPLSNVVPIGAPVRVEFQLENHSEKEIVIPGSLSMKSGHVSGKVIDPSGVAQEFATIMHYTRDVQQQVLEPGGKRKHSVTLIWGTGGPLFPQPGFYRVALDFGWFRDGIRILASGTTSVMVSAPENPGHAEAAHKVLSTPDTLLALTLGGDHRKEGAEAISAAVADPVLRPHYGLVEAKRVGRRFHERGPSLTETAGLLDDRTLMTRAEVKRIVKIVKETMMELQEEDIDKNTIHHLYNVITQKAKEAGVEDEISEAVKILKEIKK